MVFQAADGVSEAKCPRERQCHGQHELLWRRAPGRACTPGNGHYSDLDKGAQSLVGVWLVPGREDAEFRLGGVPGEQVTG